MQKKISEQLGIELGETTADKRYTFLPMTCLGDCDHAPVMMIGKELHRDLDADEIRKLLDNN